VKTGFDVFYLYAARAARGLGDGFAAIILPTYLSELGFSLFQIGIVATAALLGSALLTLAIGLLAPYYDLRTLLLSCAALMFATGAAFPNARHLVLQFAPRVRRARWEKLARLLRTNTVSDAYAHAADPRLSHGRSTLRIPESPFT
jgi:MFS family permease